MLGSSVWSWAAGSQLCSSVSGGMVKIVPRSIPSFLHSPAIRQDKHLYTLLMTVFLVDEHFHAPRHLWGNGFIPSVCLYSSRRSSCTTLIIFHVELVSCQQKCTQGSIRSEIKMAPFPRRALWLYKMDQQNPEQREG